MAIRMRNGEALSIPIHYAMTGIGEPREKTWAMPQCNARDFRKRFGGIMKLRIMSGLDRPD